MAELTLTSFLTLDGVVQAPGGPDEDRSDDFALGGWLAPFVDEDMAGFLHEVMDRAGAFLLGRRTYEIFASYWPHAADPDDPIANRLNHLPKHVVTRTLDHVDWHNSRILPGEDLTDAVHRLKQEPGGEVQVHGSGRLARHLLAHGLVDACNLLVAPVLLGSGRRLFPEPGTPTSLALTGHRTTRSGVAILTYRPTGPARFGTVGADE
ncbi:deaminase [Streptomyces sp. CC53]|uniref:dihydrofolate reductase family protein n=1 Tax=unclassified Streptomyces TaxID=2593676 RepID=UPI0008DC9A15|nr:MULTISPECIES: dihydrofolate reductase family protein [unclassified Streptomyces]OII60434.1 deaminase [Streptomyces sp. CC53]